MNRETLKALQIPLKQQYQEQPASALVSLRVEGTVDFETPGCRVPLLQNNGAEVTAGLHPNAGGDGSQACSGDMLLQALVTCAGTTLAAVSISMGLEISDAKITAIGHLDFRGTLGVDRTAAVGFTGIELLFQMQSTAEAASIEKLLQLTERYCVVYQTLIRSTPISSSRSV